MPEALSVTTVSAGALPFIVTVPAALNPPTTGSGLNDSASRTSAFTLRLAWSVVNWYVADMVVLVSAVTDFGVTVNVAVV